MDCQIINADQTLSHALTRAMPTGGGGGNHFYIIQGWNYYNPWICSSSSSCIIQQ